MSVRFVLGRAGSGKTHYCLSEMARLLREQQAGPLFFLLPQQATFIHERMLACEYTPHGYAGAEVTSFNRLIWQAARRGAAPLKPPLSEAGRALIMGRALTARRGELRVFGAGALGGGFAKELALAAEELTAYNVEPAALAQLADRRAETRPADPLAAKLADIALLYGDYTASAADYDNYSDGLTFLAREIEEYAFLAGATVFVDGYSSFTPRERAVLAALMKRAARLEIALALDPLSLERQLTEQDIFYPCWKSYGQLTEAARLAHAAVEPPLLLSGGQGRFAANAELAFMERHCYPWSGAEVWEKPPACIRVVAVANPREELAAAGREILRLVRNEGCRFRDISVIARDTAPYEELLPGVFTDLGIPYFVDAKKPLLYHPVVELTRSALEIWAGQAHYRHIFRYLKTGLTPLNAAQTDILENYCLAHGVRHWQWREDVDLRYWREGGTPAGLAPKSTILSDSQVHSSGFADGKSLLGEEAAARLAEINEYKRRGTQALARFLRTAPPAAEQVEADALLAALRQLLAELEVAQTLEQWQRQDLAAGRGAEAAMHRQALAKLEGFLDEAAVLLSGCTFAAQQLVGMIDAGCAALTLSMIPPGLDQVLVASLERSRNPELAAAIVLGVNADFLPKKVQPEALFTDAERAELQAAGMELAPGALARQMAEHYLAYVALTRSSGQLTLIYALSGSDGKSLLPSPLLKRLRTLFPALQVQRYRESADPSELTGGAATLALLACKLAAARAGQPIDSFWNDVYNWYATDEEWRGPLQRLLQGLNFAPSRARLATPTLNRLYGGTLKSSVSRLEKFRACPFAYFAAYGLKLKPRQIYEITPLERGDIFHQALAQIGRLAAERNLVWRELDEQQAAALVDEVLANIMPAFLAGILASSARYRYLAARIRDTLIATVGLMAEHMRRGHFVPVAFELPFGNREGDALPALTIELEGGRKLQINGQIDRVDMACSGEQAYFRVIDYKTGDVSLRVEDIFAGLRLQLLVYLQVVLDNSAYFQAGGALAAGMYYMPVRDEYLSGPMPPPDVDAAPAGLRLNGLTVMDEQAVRLADPAINGHSQLIPTALSAKGFYANSPGLNAEQLAELRAYLPRLLRETAGQMLAGLAEVAPHRAANFDACAYCDYRNVCGFDREVANERR